jgi:hypothetical protein
MKKQLLHFLVFLSFPIIMLPLLPLIIIFPLVLPPLVVLFPGLLLIAAMVVIGFNNDKPEIELEPK